MKNLIFGIVGPSGSGKSTLILEIINDNTLCRWLKIIKSTTSRQKRNEEDDLFYNLISKEQFELRIKNGNFIEHIEYAGNYYGFERAIVNSVLDTHYGIAAITEEGVISLKNDGYIVKKKIKIIPSDFPNQPSNNRKKDDAIREKIKIDYHKIIINSFGSSGLNKAADDLLSFIMYKILKNETKNRKIIDK